MSKAAPAAAAGSATAAAQMQAGSKDAAAVNGRAGSSGKTAAAAATPASADCSSNPKGTNKVVEVLAAAGIGLPYLPLVGESDGWFVNS
jgi:hypothetical protein